MSKVLQHFLKTLCLVTFICFGTCLSIFAQDIEAKIKILSFSPARIEIKGNFRKMNSDFSAQEISFLQSVADVGGLGKRIEKIEFYNEERKLLEHKKIIDGELKTNENPRDWQYEVNLMPSAKLTDSAHSTWLTQNHGLLMLADLLPKFGTAKKKPEYLIEIEYPKGFEIFATEPIFEYGGLSEPNIKRFSVKDYESSVILIGKNLRAKSFFINDNSGGRQFNFVTNGEWKFTDDEAFAEIQTLLKHYNQTIGSLSNGKTNIILLPFPQENSNPERWRAETRGETVTIISGNLPYKTQAVQRLNEQLRHELFHLWIPNGLALSGNYDWFYEGFTIYHALRTGVELNQIRFDDFLNTLSQAHKIEQMMLDTGQNFSLLELSDKRWMGFSNYLYAKGLAVAFLCDVAFLRDGKGKRNLKDVFRKIYENHRLPNQIQDGNSAIINILNSFPELRPVVQNFIIGKVKIDWESELNTVGIRQEKSDFGVQFKVVEKPSGRQKDFLDKLGYNQWRKFAEKKR